VIRNVENITAKSSPKNVMLVTARLPYQISENVRLKTSITGKEGPR
jgi:hypothetical protein